MDKTILQYQYPPLDLLEKAEEESIEFPDEQENTLALEHVLNTEEFQTANMNLPVALGKTTDGKPFILDLANIPHILVANGMPDDYVIKSIVASLLFTKRPDELKFVHIGNRHSVFDENFPCSFMTTIPSYNCVTRSDDNETLIETAFMLNGLMEERFRLLNATNTTNIREYNQLCTNGKLYAEKEHNRMPYVVVYISDLAIFSTEALSYTENPLTALANSASSVGIHIIASTTQPTVLTPTIKEIFPCRIALRVWHADELEGILECKGTDAPGVDEMYFRLNSTSHPIHLQGANVSQEELSRVCDYIAKQPSPDIPFVLPKLTEPTGYISPWRVDIKYADPYFAEVALYLVGLDTVTPADLQRKFCIGYNRAGRLMNQLEAAKLIVHTENPSNTRKVLVKTEDQLKSILDKTYRKGWQK